MNRLDAICVYCGSNAGDSQSFRDAAANLGRTFAKQGIRLVFGGGSVGLMGIAATACLEAGGQVTGVITTLLMEKEVGHPGVADMHVVETMHERKAMMMGLSGGFIALPGGYGTLDELFENLTWLQLGYHQKPVGVLNIDGFYDHLLTFLDHANKVQFLRPQHRAALNADTHLDALLEKMRHAEAPDVSKWLGKQAYKQQAG